MSVKKTDVPPEQPTARKKGQEDGGGDKAGDKTPEPRVRLTGKQVTAGLLALAGLLLVFFLGMRWIDGMAGQPEPTDAAVRTVPETTEPQAGKININTATLSELKELRGIGDKKAQAIIDYRSEYGPFFSIEEIKRVDGIGDGIFDAVKDEICVE